MHKRSIILSVPFSLSSLSLALAKEKRRRKNNMEKEYGYCDTELCLSPGGGRLQLVPTSESGNNINSTRAEDPQKKITIIYAGQTCMYDVTETQARAIISMAKRESDEKTAKNENGETPAPPQTMSPSPAAELPQVVNSGLSMKRSLSQFLQKRKARMGTRSPY